MAQIVALPRTTLVTMLDEARRVAEDLRAFIYVSFEGDRPPLDKLKESAGIGRITARLGLCVAWLLARQAVQAGEISRAEATDAVWRLDGHEGVAPVEDGLCAELVALERRSLALFWRISRLDAALDHSGSDRVSGEQSLH